MVNITKIKDKLSQLSNSIGKKPHGLIDVNVNNVDEIFGDSENINFFKIIEKPDVEIKPATCLEEDYLIYFQPFKSQGEYVLLDINNREFSFRNNHLLDNHLNVIYEPGLDFHKLPISRQYLSRCKRLKGTVAYLSNTLPNQYGHWFCNTFPLIRIYWKFIGKENIDYYYIGDCSIQPFQIESLAKIGIDKQQIINYPCQADRSLIGVRRRENQHGGNNKYIDLFAFNFVRDLFLKNSDNYDNSYHKRIYVKRGNVKHRKVINENKILDYLTRLGFVAIEMQGKTVREQANIFSSAEVIIAPHGSALTNLLFARPNTKVIELQSFNFPHTVNFSLASYAKADFYYIKGEKTANNQINPRYSDIKIDIHKLEKICQIANIV